MVSMTLNILTDQGKRRKSLLTFIDVIKTAKMEMKHLGWIHEVKTVQSFQ